MGCSLRTNDARRILLFQCRIKIVILHTRICKSLTGPPDVARQSKTNRKQETNARSELRRYRRGRPRGPDLGGLSGPVWNSLDSPGSVADDATRPARLDRA